MTPELEQHLREMGVVIKQHKEDKPKKVEYDMTFKDPRDENGEVPF